jgi:outer membrane immunogenic protein
LAAKLFPVGRYRLADLGRFPAVATAERAVEVGQVAESDFESDRADGPARLTWIVQNPVRQLEPLFQHELGEGDVGVLEYSDYGRIGNTDFRSSPGGDLTVDYDVKIKTHTATFGLAYKFGESSASSSAAYGAIPSTSSWTGAYLGAGVGARASQTNASVVSSSVAFAGSPMQDNLAACECFLDNAFSGTSARFNPYLGYNWQFAPQWVVGVEGDFGWANQKSTIFGQIGPGSGFYGPNKSTNDNYSVATKWDASLRLRLGYVINPSVMIYGTVGPAWMKIEESSRCDTVVQGFATAPGFDGIEVGTCAPGSATPVNITQSTVKPGFTVGVGGEARLWNDWLVRAEYRYADFGTTTFTDTRSCDGTTIIPSGTIGCHYTDVDQHAIRVKTNTAMFGIAYKFD